MIAFLFWLCVIGVIMPYAIYPAGLYLLSRFRIVEKPTGIPQPLTFVISAYNEAAVIDEKIKNTIALDYPKELLQIIVISDESDDGTDEIVRRYPEVKLIRQSPRQGKSAGITASLNHFSGDLIVFSDANAIYQADAVTHLVRRFGDPQVAYVVGQQKYYQAGGAAQESENIFWDFELKLKSWESRLSSVVGGDGAIMAIRSELFSPLRSDDINDFVLPLRMVAAGYRGCFEPQAICYEQAAPTFQAEFRRKVRIVNRSLRAVTRVSSVLNPWKVGIFSVQIFCHKVIRWFAAFLMLGAIFTSGILALEGSHFYGFLFALQGLLYTIAFAARGTKLGQFKPAMLLYYFCLSNLAGGLGVISCLLGKKFATWTPQRGDLTQPPGSEPLDSKASRHAVARGWFSFLRPYTTMSLVALGSVVALLCYIFLFNGYGHRNGLMSPVVISKGLSFLIVTIVAALFHTYGIFPLMMAILGQGRRSPGKRPEQLPSMTLIIPAHNEEEVIGQKIKNSLELDYPNLQILVASDGSTDRTVEIVHNFESVKLLDFKTQRGKSSVVNDAIAATDSELLCLCDANVMFQPDALWRLVEPVCSQHAGAVTGDVRLQSKDSTFGVAERLYYQFERCIQRGESTLGAVMGVDGGMYVIRRDLFTPLPADTILDDFTTSMHVLRSGEKLLYEPTAIAHESSTELAMDEFRRRVRLGVGASQVLCRGIVPRWTQSCRLFLFFSHKLLRWLSPWLLLVLFFASVALSFYERIAWVILFPSLLIAVIAVVGALLPQLRRHWIVAAPFYFALSQIAIAWGMASGLLFTSTGIWPRTSRTPLSDEWQSR